MPPKSRFTHALSAKLCPLVEGDYGTPRCVQSCARAYREDDEEEEPLEGQEVAKSFAARLFGD